MTPTRSIRWLEARWRAGGEAWVTHRGWSMAPALGDHDRLRVAPLDGVRPGDLVVARRAGVLVAHRLVRLDGPDGSMAVTQGDACAAPDPPVPTEALLGRVVAVRRRPWRRLLDKVRARVFR
jgi:hypothetical protein